MSFVQQGRGAAAPGLISIGEAAKLAGVNRDAIDRAMINGQLRFRRVDGKRMAEPAAVREFQRKAWSFAR
jgi:excisionase family DNA binding protein